MSEPWPDALLWNFLRGALATRALGIVADLRVADALAGGPRPVSELAGEVGADADTLHRLLRALASDGVFAEDAPGVFRNTPASELLRGGGWGEFAHLFGGTWHRAAGGLGPSGEEVLAQLRPTLAGEVFDGVDAPKGSWVLDVVAKGDEEVAVAGAKRRRRVKAGELGIPPPGIVERGILHALAPQPDFLPARDLVVCHERHRREPLRRCGSGARSRIR